GRTVESLDGRLRSELNSDTSRCSEMHWQKIDIEDTSTEAFGATYTGSGSSAAGIVSVRADGGNPVHLDAATPVGLYVNGTKVIGIQQAAIADPTGGATVDSECRTQLGLLLAAARTHGWIAT